MESVYKHNFGNFRAGAQGFNVSRGFSGIRYRKICLETGRNLAGKEDVGIRGKAERMMC